MMNRLSRRSQYALQLAILGLFVLAGGWLWARGQSSKPGLVEAATQFVASLSDEQRSRTLLEFKTPQRVQWHYVPLQQRKGLPIAEMNSVQRERAQTLLRAALSEVGHAKARGIMELEAILDALEKDRPAWFRDPERYFFVLLGEPAEQGRWQLSVEGHHLSLNFTVDQGRIVAHTPAFLGANPAEVKADYPVGPKRGTRILGQEEQRGFDLLHALSPEQAARAVIAARAPREILSGNQSQPPQLEPAGLSLTDMDERQRQAALDLLAVYIGNLPAEVADAEWQSLRTAGLEQIRFAWAGAREPGVGHYYRLQGPTLLVELCNTQPDAAGNPANHVHTVYRRLSGDFGEKQ